MFKPSSLVIFTPCCIKKSIRNTMRALSHILLLICCVIMLNCNSRSKKELQTTDDVKTEDTNKISSNDIEALAFDDYILSNASKTKIMDWQKLHELNTQVEFLKKGDLSFFSANDSIVKSFVFQLKEETPENVDTDIIKSRVTALETKILKLNNTIELTNIPKEEVLMNIKEVLVAMSNLNFQINKKFELDANNIEKPL